MDLPKIKQLEPKRTITPLTESDIRCLLATGSWRDRLVVILATTTGLRFGELTQLTVNDIKEVLDNKEAPYMVIVRDEIAKGGRGYISFMTEEAAELLRNWIRVMKLTDADILFLQPWVLRKAFRRLLLKSKLEGDRVLHSFRKFYRTKLASVGIPEPFVDRMIGHHQSSLSQICIHVHNILTNLRQ